MKYYDITMSFSEQMITFEGDPKPVIETVNSIDEGDLYNLSRISFGSHVGTHVDAPLHFCRNGKAVEELSLERFIGKAKVIEIFDPASVKKSELMQHDIFKDDIIILKTENTRRKLLSKAVFERDFCYMEKDAAEFLAEIGISTLGYDYLSPEKFEFDFPWVHITLLERDIVIVEGLNLEGVPPGEYGIIMLPMKIVGGNGSPVRAVLFQKEG